MSGVLFVCLGNLARSQMAEGFFRKFTGRTDVASAGVDACFACTGRGPASSAILVMGEKGIDISKQDVTQLEESMVDDADVVYVLCNRSTCPPYLQESSKAVFWEIHDPWNSTMDGYRTVRDNIEEKIKLLL